MVESYDYHKRADEIADATRRFLVGLHTGGIAIALAVAGNLASEGVSPAWVVWTVVWFAAGLVMSGWSLLWAKHKALKRRSAARENKPIPPYNAWWQRNFTIELLTLVIFVIAIYVGLSALQAVKLEKTNTQGKSDPVVQKQLSNEPLERTLTPCAPLGR